jgi:probable HAF family extracellular repeat protein
MRTAIRNVRNLAAAMAAAWALSALATPADAQGLYAIRAFDAAGCAPIALNDQGTVAGDCGTAIVWQNGVTTNLGKLPKGTYSEAWSINAQGVVVGEGDTGDGRPDPVLFRNGAVIDIDANSANARAIYINDAGVIVGDYLKGFDCVCGWSAVIWTERPDRPGRFDRLTLAPYPGGDAKVRYGYATGANQGIQVVGWVQNSLIGQLGAFWDNHVNHTLSLLQPLPDQWTSLAWAVNDLGQAVGASYGGLPGGRATLWLDDATHTPVDLGVLAGDTESTAQAINNLGQVIGTSMAADGTMRPFIWQNGQMVELGSLLDATGADWVLQYVTAINNVGEIIGGGRYQGQPRTFVLTPAGP